MRPFAIERVSSLDQALVASARPGTMVIAGGTEVLNWLKEGIASPSRLVDINAIPDLAAVQADTTELRIGALARMSDVAAHGAVRRDYPAIAQALLKSASPQIRNMASMGGNLLQRNRCPYFRAETLLPCNKRVAGTGCSARIGEDRATAIFGWSEHCIATHPSDVAVALAALDASVEVISPQGLRKVALDTLYRAPDGSDAPDIMLLPGELIGAINVPASPAARSSAYLKVRERASYEFALVSVAAAFENDAGVIRNARLAMGGVAHKPWRLRMAENALEGSSITDAAALRRAVEQSFEEARPGRHNGFKIELGIRAAIRAIQIAGGRA